MTTKAPSSVVEFSADSLEKLAYSLAQEITAAEKNDNYRLGYCLWGWLSERRGSLRQAVHAAGIRSALREEEILEFLNKRLREKGIDMP